MRRVGVLALQGGYAAHRAALGDLGFDAIEVRDEKTLAAVEGLVLPGGESTTHLKLLDRYHLGAALDAFVRAGHPVLATCAGLILAARTVVEPAQRSFGWIDITVARNAWGRQVHSFEAVAETPSDGPFAGTPLPLVFIRAPRIRAVGAGVEVLAKVEGEPVMVRQANVLGATFHPELTADRRVHALAFG